MNNELENMHNSHTSSVYTQPQAVLAPGQNATSRIDTQRNVNLSNGFTLVELLIVIGIIVVLIALLVPVIGRVRTSAYEVNTRNEISEIAAACERYNEDFKSYPGPISNSDLETHSTGANTGSVPYDTYHDQAGGDGPTPLGLPLFGMNSVSPIDNKTKIYFTSSENIVLGLLGGLWINPNYSLTPLLQFVNGPGMGSKTTFDIPNTLIGTGPRSLLPGTGSNTGLPTSNKQYNSYLPVTFPGSPLMLNGDGSPETGITPYVDFTGSRSFQDHIVPVFTDQFPDHMPILYMRARRGAKGVISGPSSFINGSIALPATASYVMDPITNAQAHYNYDLLELVPYTWVGDPPKLTAPAPGTSTGSGILGVTPSQHGLEGVGFLDFIVLSDSFAAAAPQNTTRGAELAKLFWNNPVPTNVDGRQNPTYPDSGLNNAGQYFLNPLFQPTNTTTTDQINATGVPRNKDGFILISAGKDRIYGTGDDLTNFGDVEP